LKIGTRDKLCGNCAGRKESGDGSLEVGKRKNTAYVI